MDNKLLKTQKSYRVLSIIIVIMILCMTFSPVIMVTADSETDNKTPIDVEPYITAAKLYYKLPESEAWTKITDNMTETIPGNATIRLDASYQAVPIQTLLDSGCQMSYKLPVQLKTESGYNSFIRDDNNTKNIGTIVSSGNDLIITFDKSWLQSLPSESTVIDGKFSVETNINRREANKQEIKINNITIKANFDPSGKMIAEYGDVKINKGNPTLILPTTSDTLYYLQYTLTVTAGEDGAVGVKVKDNFNENSKQYTDGYTAISLTVNQTSSKNIPDITDTSGNMVWNIGNMNPNDVYELTYKVKLKDTYLTSASKDIITNTADVYSEYDDKSYKKGSDSSEYTPNIDINITKSVTQGIHIDNNSKQYVIDYNVKVTNNCAYPLNNLKIQDQLSLKNGQYLSYVSYVQDSFKIDNNPVTDSSVNINSENKSFDAVIDSIGANSTKTLTYQVTVDPEIFIKLQNNSANLTNTAKLFSENGTEPLTSSANISQTLKKTWSKKIVGDTATTEQKTISMNTTDTYYNATGGTIDSVEQITNQSETSFVVPKGSFKYTVTINSERDWDMSQAEIKDSLNSEYLKFVGYAKVEELTTSGEPHTVWLKIDGTQSFVFTPQSIGLTNKYSSYTITYYAQPYNISGITQVNVTNTLTVSGKVGSPGGTTLNINVSATQTVTVYGEYSFKAEKTFMYYNPDENDWDKDGTDDSTTGALYWAIKIDGNKLIAGTQLKDTPWSANGYYVNNLSLRGNTTSMQNYLGKNSFVGAYTINSENIDFSKITDSEDLNQLVKNGKISIFQDFLNNTTLSYESDHSATTITVNKNIDIPNGQSLFIVMRTRPQYKPTNDRDALKYSNKLQKRYNDKEKWILNSTATTPYIYTKPEVFKELGCIFTYDGSDLTYINPYNYSGSTDNSGIISSKDDLSAKTQADQLLGDVTGTFVAWQVHVNYGGTLE